MLSPILQTDLELVGDFLIKEFWSYGNNFLSYEHLNPLKKQAECNLKDLRGFKGLTSDHQESIKKRG